MAFKVVHVFDLPGVDCGEKLLDPLDATRLEWGEGPEGAQRVSRAEMRAKCSPCHVHATVRADQVASHVSRHHVGCEEEHRVGDIDGFCDRTHRRLRLELFAEIDPVLG